MARKLNRLPGPCCFRYHLGLDIPGQREPSPDTLLLERLREISDRCAARSVVDPRSDDDLVGYDQGGLPN